MAQIDARGLTVNNVKGDQYNHIDVHGEMTYRAFYSYLVHLLKSIKK